MFIADWLWRHNHAEEKNQLIKGMEVQVDIIQTVTYMPECLSVMELQQTSSQDDHLQKLKNIPVSAQTFPAQFICLKRKLDY